MCPQPPLTSIINPCLTPPVIGAYLTGGLSILISCFLLFIILRNPKKTALHYLLALIILFNSISLSLGGILIASAGNPQRALNTYLFLSPLAILAFYSFYWFIYAFLKLKEKWFLIFNITSAIIATPLLFLFPIIKGIYWNQSLGWYDFEINPTTSWILYLGFFFWFWALWRVFQAYRKSYSIIEKNRLKYFGIASFIFIIGHSANLIPGFTRAIAFDGIGSTIYSVVLTYAILRYQLLDITFVIRKGLLYSLLTTIITSLYLLFSLFLQLFFQESVSPVFFPVAISTALVVALVFQPLQSRTQKLIDRLFFRQKYDPQKLVARLSRVFAQTIDLDPLATRFLDLLCQTLQIKQAALFLINGQGDELVVSKVKNLPPETKDLKIPFSSPLIKFLSQSNEARSKDDLQEKNISLEKLEPFNLDLFVPLRSQDRLRGLLALGPKLSEELYSLEELHLFETIASGATIALDKAALFNQLNQEKIKVEKEKKKTTAIITHLTDGILVFDATHHLSFLNLQAQNFLQVKEKDVLGQSLRQLAKLDRFQPLVKPIKNKVSQKEISYQKEKTLSLSTLPVAQEDQKEKMLLVVLHDITEAKKLEEMKTDFASIAAHELRTPLTSIRGFLAMALDESRKRLTRESQHYLENALKSSDRLNSLIESLLAVTKVEKGQTILKIAPLSLEPLMKEVLVEIKPLASAKDQKVSLVLPSQPLPQIKADKQKVKEMLVNLLDNAIRYTQEGGQIKVSTRLQKEWVTINVKDNGPGIPEAIKPLLFKKFLRGEKPLVKETEGVGLGLYLVKSLVEMQGGKVWYQSQKGKGSVFSFKLPRAIQEMG